MPDHGEFVTLIPPAGRCLALIAAPDQDANVFPVIALMATRDPAPPPATVWGAVRRLLGLDAVPPRPVRLLPVVADANGNIATAGELAAAGCAIHIVSPHWQPSEDGEYLANVLDELRREVAGRPGRRTASVTANGRPS